MNEAIKISNLTKSYGTHAVLKGLNFSGKHIHISASEIRYHIPIGFCKVLPLITIHRNTCILKSYCFVQILSFKHLGFSLDDIKNRLITLDTPAEIADVLMEQAAAVKQKIERMSESLRELEMLREENSISLGSILISPPVKSVIIFQ